MVTGGYERKGRAVIVNGLMYGSIADAAADKPYGDVARDVACELERMRAVGEALS